MKPMIVIRCPYCGSALDETWQMCCEEVHGEEIEVCEFCEYEPEECECEQ